ncbi:MbtH family NRPS accessory protein [Amycolatopsis sp. NPDC059657]|uniref:MbtH family NRPS accessory protein n=1 Tax=Amycolatopsis sp. NPDC059657 TaxID=3346899 RepID=UPI00367226EB
MSQYRVVRNNFGQHSLLSAWQRTPEGWTEIGFEGPRTDCLEEINRVWTDLRPCQEMAN